MKKLVVTGSLIAVSIVGILGYWISQSFEANASQFDHSVSVALYAVADTMSERATIEKLSSNLYYVSTNSPLSNKEIDTLVEKEFKARNLELDYEIGIYNAEDDSLVYGSYVKASETRLLTESQCDESDLINKNFAILFPSRQNYIFAQTDILLIAFVLLISFSWIYFYFTNQIKASPISVASENQIRIGSSCLDYHNQSLEVQDATFNLTHKENQILKLLFENPNQVINREIFLENIWEKDGFFVARSMDVFISKVRKYLSTDEKIKIENLRSIGYRLHVRK